MHKEIIILEPEMASIARRFWSRVAIGQPGECWRWQGSCGRRGYGHISIGGRLIKTHRLAYLLTFGEQPGEMVIHSCDNPPCCNPRHLKSGTAKENSDDMIAKGRKAPGEKINFRCGADNPNVKLSASQIADIKSLRATGLSLKEIGARYGVTRFAISKIVRGITWKLV